MKAVNLLPTQRRTTVSFVVAQHPTGLRRRCRSRRTRRHGSHVRHGAEPGRYLRIRSCGCQDAGRDLKRSIAAVAAAAAAIPASEKLVGNAAKVAEARFAWAPLFHQLATHLPAKVMFTALSVTLIRPTPHRKFAKGARSGCAGWRHRRPDRLRECAASRRIADARASRRDGRE